MPPEDSSATKPKSRRSRAGCYTCKIRKVRCGSPRDGDHATLSACANCERLGLPCQWNKPAEGENYTPPPKRRRTVGNRRRGQDGDVSPSPLPQQILQEGSNEPAESIKSADAAEFELQAFTDLTDLQLDLPEEFDFDAGLGVEPNLFWSGEGVDFIPLPLIESTPTLFQTTADNYLQVEMPPVAQLPCLSPDTDRDPLGQDTDISAFSITGNVDTRRLIQHYLEVMNGYSKVTDHGSNNNNLFIAAFSKSLFFMPLYYAILSFSASHLSLQDPSLADTACRLENLAEEHFNRAFQDYTAKVEGLLSALFVRVKRVHVMGESVSSFLRLISIATEIIFSNQGREALETPSELSGRIVLRLATLDARASCYRLGGGLLVRRLREIASLSFIFKFEDNESSSTSAFVHLLRADILRMRVGQLDLRVHEHKGSVELDEVEMLQADIKTLIHRWEQHLSKYTKEGATVSALPAGVYGCYTVLGALHSALLYLHSVYPLDSIDTHCSVAEILNHQLLIHRDPSRAASPSSILPSSLFLAAIFTKDPIYRDWAIKILQDGERWGLYVKKTNELVEAVCRMRERDNCVDIGLAMENTTGRFVI